MTTKMATRRKKMATRRKKIAQVCKERMGDASALLDIIGQELGRIGGCAEDDFSWPVAGTLGLLRRNLIETLMALCPISEAEIEDLLAEMHEKD